MDFGMRAVAAAIAHAFVFIYAKGHIQNYEE